MKAAPPVTLLPDMRHATAKFFLLELGIAVVLNGCASSAPPLPPSLDLPAPATDLRALRKGDRVYLAWTIPTQTTDQEAIRHPGPTLICRSMMAMTECGAAVGEVPASAEAGRTASNAGSPANQVTATYVDPLPVLVSADSPEEVNYSVEVLNPDRRGAGLSNQVQVPAAPAPPPPADFDAKITAEGVRLTWSCPAAEAASNAHYRLRIFRRLQGTEGEVRIAEPDLASCQGPAVLDQTFEWEKTYEYSAAAVLVLSPPGKPEIEIEGDDTPSVTVFAHDVFPPHGSAGAAGGFFGSGTSAFCGFDLVPGYRCGPGRVQRVSPRREWAGGEAECRAGESSSVS